MSKQGDYIPRSDSELVAWSANFTAKVAAGATAWSIPAEEVARLQKLNTDFAALHAQADSPDKTKVIVAKKDSARKTLVDKIREMANFRLKNPIITDDERISLGLHVHDTTPSSIGVPVHPPELDLEVIDFGLIKVHFYDKESGNKARPYGMSGAVIAYGVLDTPPENESPLNESVLATRNPHVLSFHMQERGKTVYVSICWQNEKGEKGPWSKIQSTIIP
jgi:hypothetical protein